MNEIDKFKQLGSLFFFNLFEGDVPIRWLT